METVISIILMCVAFGVLKLVHVFFGTQAVVVVLVGGVVVYFKSLLDSIAVLRAEIRRFHRLMGLEPLTMTDVDAEEARDLPAPAPRPVASAQPPKR